MFGVSRQNDKFRNKKQEKKKTQENENTRNIHKLCLMYNLMRLKI